MSDYSTSSNDSPVWKDIPGYEGYYQVSNYGQVRRTKRVTKAAGIMTGIFDSKRYLQVKLTVQGKSKTFKIHRLVMLAFAGERPEGFQINHKNGNKADNRLNNLEYVSPRENVYHAYAVLNHQGAIGELAGGVKLNETDVQEIRRKFATGTITKTELAKQYSISRFAVYAIVTGKTWKHIL